MPLPSSRLDTELAALRVAEIRLARAPDSHALHLEVLLRRRAAHAAQHAAPQEPLPDLIAKLLRGEISTDTAGHAIARDPALAGQVAQTALGFGNGNQTGDIRTGDIAAGNIIHITIGGSS